MNFKMFRVGRGRLHRALHRPPKAWDDVSLWQRYGLAGLYIVVLTLDTYIVEKLTPTMHGFLDYTATHLHALFHSSYNVVAPFMLMVGSYCGPVWMGWLMTTLLNACRKSLERDFD